MLSWMFPELSANTLQGPYPTTVTAGNNTYTVTSATTLTITDCPCHATKTYPGTVSTTTTILTTVSFLAPYLKIPSNFEKVLPRANHHYIVWHNIPDLDSWDRHYPDCQRHNLPNLQPKRYLRPTSSYHLPTWNWCPSSPRQHRNQGYQHPQGSFSDHLWPSPGHWQCWNEGRGRLRCFRRCRYRCSPLVDGPPLHLFSITSHENNDLTDGW